MATSDTPKSKHAASGDTRGRSIRVSCLLDLASMGQTNAQGWDRTSTTDPKPFFILFIFHFLWTRGSCTTHSVTMLRTFQQAAFVLIRIPHAACYSIYEFMGSTALSQVKRSLSGFLAVQIYILLGVFISFVIFCCKESSKRACGSFIMYYHIMLNQLRPCRRLTWPWCYSLVDRDRPMNI